MSQTFVSLDINAPVEAVFAALANIETFPDRAEAIAAVEFLSDQKHGVGTRFRETRIMNGREAVAELEVTEQVENERIRMVCDQGGTVWDTVFKVTPISDGIRLEMTMDARPHKLMAKLTIPIINLMIKKFVQKDMEEVKAWCERPAS